MNNEEKCDDSLQPKDVPSTKKEKALLPEASLEDTSPSVPIAIENKKPDVVEAIKEQIDGVGSRSLSVDHEPRTEHAASSFAAKQKIVEVPEALPKDPSPSVPIPIKTTSGCRSIALLVSGPRTANRRNDFAWFWEI
jgi:hypothetical protein